MPNPYDQFVTEANPYERFLTPEKEVEGGFVASAKQAIGATVKGAGQFAADLIPGVGQDNAVKRYGQSVIDANPTAVHGFEDMADKPFTTVKEATGNAAGSIGGMLATRAVGQGITALSPLAGPAAPIVALVGQAVSWLGPAAIASLPSYGGIRDKQILNDPANENDAKSIAIAAMGAAAVGAIETKFGPQNWALGAMTKEGRAKLAEKFAATTLGGSVLKGVARGGAVEGAEELVQNPIEQLAAGDDPTSPENVRETLFGGAMGAIGGGVLGGGFGLAGRQAKPEPKPDPIPDILNAPDVDSAINAARAATQERAADLFGGQQRDPLAGAMREFQANPPGPMPAIAPDAGSLLERADPLAAMLEDRRIRNEAFSDVEQQRQGELDSIQQEAAALNLTADGRGERQRSVERAADLQAPTALQLAMQRARTAQEPQSPEANVAAPAIEAPAPVKAAQDEPRLVERTADMVALPRQLAESRAAAQGGEVVRIQNKSGKFAYAVIPKEPDGTSADVSAVVAGAAGSRGTDSRAVLAPGVRVDGNAESAVAPGGVADQSQVQPVPLGAVPASTWFGRRGDGYVTEADARMALPARQKVAPDLEWKVEAMPAGKFRLAGYAGTAVKSGDGQRPIRAAGLDQNAVGGTAATPERALDGGDGAGRASATQAAAGSSAAAGTAQHAVADLDIREVPVADVKLSVAPPTSHNEKLGENFPPSSPNISAGPAAADLEPAQFASKAEYIEAQRQRLSGEADRAIAEAEALPDDWLDGIWSKQSNVAQIKQRYADRSADNLMDLRSFERHYDSARKRKSPTQQPSGAAPAEPGNQVATAGELATAKADLAELKAKRVRTRGQNRADIDARIARWEAAIADIEAGQAAPEQRKDTTGDLIGITPEEALAAEQAKEAAQAKKPDDDDMFAQLFGTPAEQAAAQAKFEADAAVKKADMARVREAIAAEKKRAEAEHDDWSGRVYKANKTQVELHGDGPSNRGSLSIGSINESRRRNAMDALAQEIKALDKLAEAVETDSGAERVLNNLRTLMDKTKAAVESGNWPNYTQDSMFESMLLDDLKFRGPGGKGSITSNGLSKAMLAALPKEAAQAKPADDSTVPMYSRSAETSRAYEARIDALMGNDPANRIGVRILDRSDVLGMMGYSDSPVTLQESKVVQGRFNHHLRAEHWKKIPQWLEEPAAVFESDTVPGRLVFIAPELVNGAPVLMAVELDASVGATNVHLLVSAYDKERGRLPVMRWASEGLVKYIDQKRFPAILATSGLQLPRVLQEARGNGRTILGYADLVKSRDSSASYRRGDTAPATLTPAEIRTALAQPLARLTIPYAIHASNADAKKATGASLPAGVKGLYAKGKLHLVLDGIASPLEAEAVYWHEVSHAGIDALYGTGSQKYENALRGLSLQNPNIRQAAKVWLDRHGKQDVQSRIDASIEAGIASGMSETAAKARAEKRRPDVVKRVNIQAIDEALAELSGRNAEIKGLPRFIAAVQEFMRSIGLNRLADYMESLTDAQALTMILNAREAVMGQEQAQGMGDAQPAFAQDRGTTPSMASRKDVVGRGTKASVPDFDTASGDYNPDLSPFWIKKAKEEIRGDGMPDAEYHQAIAEYANARRVESLLEQLGWRRRGGSNISSSTYFTKDVAHPTEADAKTYEVRVSDHDDFHPADDSVEARYQLNFRDGTAQWSNVDVGPDLNNADALDRLRDILPNESQGGRSADDKTKLRLAPYTQAEMIARGADGNLSRGYERYIPIDKLDGLEPTPANNESDDGKYLPGRPITQPIEVQANLADDTFMVYSGNHRIAQAKANGQKHILAFVEPDPNDRRGIKKDSPTFRTNPDANDPPAPNSDGASFSQGEGAKRDPAEDNISFSRASIVGNTTPGSWNAPEPSKFDNMVYTMQDKQVDTKRVVQAIREASAGLADQADVYLQEELFHGRAAKRTEDFVSRELKPLLLDMQMRGITQEQLDKYLHARHAEEANELIAGRNPAIQDGGSGMKTADARAFLSGLGQAERQRIEQVAAKVDAILAATRNLYVAYGLESAQTVDGWRGMFQHYVPLMREDHDGGMGVGQGYSIKGRESKGRTGSASKVVDILANIAMQRERAITRGEKNRVSNALLGLAESNPNEDFWRTGSPPSEQIYNPKTNAVDSRTDPLFKSRDNVIVAKVRLADGSVEERAVIFNEDSERAVRMATALKNLDAAKLEGLLGVSAKITRYFAAINTQLSPIFGTVNFTRDVQGAMVNLSSTELAGQQKKIAGDALSALRGIYIDARATRAGKPTTSIWAALWEDFQNEGGQTGYRDLFSNSADRANAIEAELNPTGWMDSPLGKVFTVNGALKMPLKMAQERAKGLFGWLSDYNLAMENAVRLSAYKAGLDSGMSKQQAASLAKNLTVNFNRKGQVGQQAGAVYAFFNAAVQGTARLGQTLFDMDGSDVSTIRLSKTGKKIVYGGILLGTMQALLLAAAGFDDEEPPDFVRERSLIIPIGGKKYITIPMPLGLHVIPNMGRIPTEFVLGGFKKPGQHLVKLIGLFTDAFNPIGGAGLSLQTIAPTAIDPFAALAENRDWTGKPIAKTGFNKATPGHALVKDTASAPAKFLSHGINLLSGGTDHVAGVFSPTPDQIDYLWGQVTGGVGREAGKLQQTLSASASGEDLPPHKIPLLGRFYGDSQTQSAQAGSFYASLNRINEYEAEIKGLRKEGKGAELSAYLKDNPEARLFQAANSFERTVQKLRVQKRDLMAKDAPDEQIKAVEKQITDRMTRFNDLVRGLKEKKAA